MRMVYLMVLIAFAPVVLIVARIPYLSRKTNSFGISIPEDDYEADKLIDLRKAYSNQILLFGVFLLTGCFVVTFNIDSSGWNVAFASALLIYAAGSHMVYLKFHSQMKELKTVISNGSSSAPGLKEVDIGHQHQHSDYRLARQSRLAISNGWFASPLHLYIGTLAATFIWYNQFPAIIPTNYDRNGSVAS